MQFANILKITCIYSNELFIIEEYFEKAAIPSSLQIPYLVLQRRTVVVRSMPMAPVLRGT